MGNRYYNGPISDHFDGKQFHHAGLPSTDKSVFEILRWRLFGKRNPWPAVVPARSGLKPEPSVDGVRITAIGHASFLVQVAKVNILVDPVWSERVSPFKRIGPIRHNPAAVAFDDLPIIHAVLITHNHYDHMDTSTIAKLWERDCPSVITPLGNDAVLRKDIPNLTVQTGDWWDAFDLSDQVRTIIVPAYHWSARNLGDRRFALWGGFVLETPFGSLYCAGDTGYQDGKIFAEIRRRLGAPLVAILPIGAYEPRWFMKSQHADPAEAVQIALDCGAQHLLGVHWGTFQLTDEPCNEPAELLQSVMTERAPTSLQAIPFRAGDIWEPNF